ncbi:MAG: hypothetical protein MUP55_01295 [Candidatus Aenigmarchaeota archaeon]|nr:hypothetical protein [Candidatus Aenigmarchaeota archaeon]
MTVWRSIKKYTTGFGAGLGLLGIVASSTLPGCITANFVRDDKGAVRAMSIGQDASDTRYDPRTGVTETKYPSNKPQFIVPAYPGYYYNGYYGGGYYPRYNYPHVILP